MAPAKDGADKARDSEEDFMPLVTFLQKYGSMGWDEILDAPLIRLNSIQEGLTKHLYDELSTGVLGSLGSLAGSRTAKATPSEPYREMKFKIPSTGEMKTPDEMTREEYFEWVNSVT